MNRLYYGDCLTVMQEMPDASVDLIYLDPPFSSQRNYNAIYKDETGRELPDQVEAFCDMWELDAERERVIRHMPILVREAGIDDATAQFWQLWMNALRGTQPRLLAYLSYMVERLLVMKRLIKPTGSIYLHCDPTASHYLKVMMDGIFGHGNFRNEIVWNYSGWNAKLGGKFNSRHDILLFYSNATKGMRFNSYAEPWKSEAEYVRTRKQKIHTDEEGRRYVTSDRGGGKRIRRYLDEAMAYGKPVSDVWLLDKLNNSAKEHMGYATQKPLALLDRIIKASSNPGDLVMDPFCGCATTIEAAHKLGRRWVGVDIAIHAIKRVAAIRLRDRLKLKLGEDYEIRGMPRNVEGAQDLWTRDKYHFQKWAVEQINGFVTSKRTADGGIDGRLYFDMPGERALQSMVLEVKGGKNVTIADVRGLRGVLEREEAQMAGLIVMHPPGDVKARNFRREMAAMGDLDIPGHAQPYPRMQMLTVEQIFAGEQFATPGTRGRGNRQIDMLLDC